MPDYLVTWAVDIEGAVDRLDAAQRAAHLLFRGYALRSAYEVKDKATGETETVDLEELEE